MSDGTRRRVARAANQESPTSRRTNQPVCWTREEGEGR